MRLLGEISISLNPLFQSSDSQVESVVISARPVLLEKHFRGLQPCSTGEKLQGSLALFYWRSTSGVFRARIREVFDCDEQGRLGWV